MARVYETVTVLCLLGTLVLGMTYILSALIDHQKSSLHTLLSKYGADVQVQGVTFTKIYHLLLIISDLSTYYLPFLYSCVSFVGVVMLLRKYN